MTMMRNDGVPVLKDVVLVGAGHAHIQVLKRFGMDPVPGLRFTLVTREVHTPFSGMLPGLICGYYGFDETHIDTGPLTRFAGARLYNSSVTGIDRAAKLVICNNRPPVAYDILSIDTGSTPNTTAIPGAAEWAVPVKPIDGFLARFDGMLARTLEAGARHIAVVGAGAAGVELILAVQQRMRAEVQAAGRDPASLAFTLVTATPDILPNFPAKARDRFYAILASRGIHVVAGVPVTHVERGALHFEARQPVEADEILWATAAQPPLWLRDTGLALDDQGFIKVGDTLLAEGCDDIFAAGDVIAFGPRALPKSGLYSVRSGPVLAENIRRLARGKRLKPFKPQREGMSLITTGEKHAIGVRNGYTFAGKWVWRWKRRIDSRFIAAFNTLPELGGLDEIRGLPVLDEAEQRELSGDGLRCGGAGATVGAAIEARAFGSIRPLKRPEVLSGLETGDDAAVIDLGGDLVSVQSVEYFRAMIDDPYLFGRIAANHALNDIYAMGGNPETAQAIATLPHGLERKTAGDLAALLAGANEVLAESGCQLTGGHTTEGEFGLGLALTGVVPRDRVLRKGGAQPGDVLILTKPLGTGTLLAADMRCHAKARWIVGAIVHMLQSNRAASAVLTRHHAHAATDVGGFGLLGHLAEMLRASKMAGVIQLDALRVLNGAAKTLEAGLLSSAHAQNLRARRVIRQAENLAHPLYPLLFDPQTVGGLLTAVPRGAANAVMNELAAAGYTRAAIIGEVVPWDGAAEFVSLRS